MKTPDKFTAAIVQQSCSDDLQANLTNSIALVQQAKAQGAQLVLLQELHRSRYFCQTEDAKHFDLAESIPGPTSQQLAIVAADLDIVLVASLFEKRAPGLYHNTAIVLDRKQGLVGKYRKMHIPDDPGFMEKYYFTPGDLGFHPIPTSLGKLGVLICWDQWYPEAARLMALRGAELLLYPTAIGWDPQDTHNEQQRQLDAWMTIQRAHSISNGLPVLTANRVGFEPTTTSSIEGIQFWGNSFITGSFGELLAQAGLDEQILLAEINKGATEQTRRTWPFLRDRRIDQYSPLTQRYLDQQEEK